MAAKRKIDDISREEDFRDYDDRNIDEGWPYDDASGAGARPIDNAAYGQPPANFDDDRNGGFQVDEADSSGLQERLIDSISPETKGVEDSDDLEERITDALEQLGVVDMESIDIHVMNGRVTIEGVVDEASAARRIVREVRGIEGVGTVVSNLRLAGVDSRIPDED